MLFTCLMMIEDEEERKSLTELYYIHRQRCVYIAKKYTHNESDAEDIVHDVFVKVIEHRNEYLKISKDEFKCLVIAMTKNAGVDFVRKKQRLNNALAKCQENMADRIESGEEMYLQHEAEVGIMKELQVLDEISRKIMIYKSLSFSIKEIAYIMKMPYRTVETKFYRARNKLKKKREGAENDN